MSKDNLKKAFLGLDFGKKKKKKTKADLEKSGIFIQSDTLATNATEDSTMSADENLPSTQLELIKERQKEDELAKEKRYKNILGTTLLGLGILNELIPDNLDQTKIVTPQDTYNPNMYGTGSQAIYKKGGELSAAKAKEMLKDGTAHGKKLTKKQKRYFGMVAAGKAAFGLEVPGEDDPKDPNYQKRLAVANQFAKDFARRRGHINAEETFVESPDTAFVGLDNKPFQPLPTNRKKVYKLPVGITLNDIKSYGDEHWYEDPQTGDAVYVDNSVLSKFSSTQPQIQNALASRGQFEDGGSIHIKKKNRGKFTAAAKRAGMGVQEYARKVLKDPDASPTLKKRANFARNAAKWKHEDGGEMFGEGSTSELFEFKGPSHENGGIPITYQGQTAEVEGGETAFIDNEGDLNILGNMYVPGTKKKFKQVGKELAKEEEKNTKILDKGLNLVKLFEDPSDKMDKLSFNTGKVMLQGGLMEKNNIDRKKENLANLQNAILKSVNKSRASNMESGGEIPYANIIERVSKEKGVDPEIIKKLIFQESGGKTSARSSKNALGIMQMIPETAKSYGISERQLTSNSPEDVEKVISAGITHFSTLLKNNNNDYKLALAAYNGGQGSVDFVRKQLGKKSITGDEWLDFMHDRRTKSPSNDRNAWQNQTYDYVNIITGNQDEFNTKASKFRNEYYSPDVKVPDFTPFEVPEITEGTPAPKSAPTPFEYVPNTYDFTQRPAKNPAPIQSPLEAEQLAGEIYTLATNQVEPVDAQFYRPQLFEPYSVSFQDRLNMNQSTFNATQRVVGNNPEALSVLAGQKYAADNQVLGEEFRINQQIVNDVTNKNIGLLNDSQLKNLGIADTQMVRQSTARSKTKAQTQLALQSIGDKTLKNRYENLDSSFKQMLFKYRPVDKDNDGLLETLEYQGDAPTFYPGTPGTQPNQEAIRTRTEYDGEGRTRKVTKTEPSLLEQEKMKTQARKAFFERMANPFTLMNQNRKSR
jgi:hypothetical protein